MAAPRPAFRLRIPVPIGGIQVNFCKNPECVNFGMHPKENIKGLTMPAIPDPITGKRHRDRYTVNSKGKAYPSLCCHSCKQRPPIKSNLGVHEEYNRMRAYLSPPAGASCSNTACRNHDLAVATHPLLYQKHGTTEAKSRRYRCKSCGKLFSVKSRSINRQAKSYKNIMLFKLLVNKMPFQRICEILDFDMKTLYHKIDFLHEQCLAYAAHHESRLPDLKLRRLYISTDRQDYIVNWGDAGDRRNVVLQAVGSADNRSGYVFGMHVNYDAGLDNKAVEADAVDIDDYALKSPFRKYARLWLEQDYAGARLKSLAKSPANGNTVSEEILHVYADAQLREDIEAFEMMTSAVKLPLKGMLVHSEYTLYGHMLFLKHLLRSVENIRFFLDQESGIRAATIAAFVDEIMAGRCDAFYVTIKKDLTINQKNSRMAMSRRTLDNFCASLGLPPGEVDDNTLRLMLIEGMLKSGNLITLGGFKDKWLMHPAPSKNEPEKGICWLTDMGNRRYGNAHLARLYTRASLHGIDRFFMQIRRRMSLLERPIRTSSSSGRVWYGYSPYKPENIIKLLDIFRVFYNFAKPGQDGRTPAARLGLAKGNGSVEDIIYYVLK